MVVSHNRTFAGLVIGSIGEVAAQKCAAGLLLFR